MQGFQSYDADMKILRPPSPAKSTGITAGQCETDWPSQPGSSLDLLTSSPPPVVALRPEEIIDADGDIAGDAERDALLGADSNGAPQGCQLAMPYRGRRQNRSKAGSRRDQSSPRCRCPLARRHMTCRTLDDHENDMSMGELITETLAMGT